MYSNSPFGFDGTRIFTDKTRIKRIFYAFFGLKRICFAQFASLGLCFKKIEYFFETYVSRFSNGELLTIFIKNHEKILPLLPMPKKEYLKRNQK
jgi:hypothetical protein